MLIVKMSALGDVVHAVPVLPFLRSANRDICVHWLVEKAFEPVLASHPAVDRIHTVQIKVWRREGMRRLISGVRKSIAALRTEQYDVVLDIQGNMKSALFTGFSGAEQKWGFDSDGVREWPNLLATNHKISLQRNEYHIADRALAVARAAFPDGKDVPTCGPLYPTVDAADRMEQYVAANLPADHPVVVLHPGTTWTTKCWPAAYWQELARALADQGFSPLLTWSGDEEHKLAVQIAGEGGEGIFIAPEMQLDELMALLQRVDCVVGGDTGPVHIAAATGTPTVSLFRATDARRNAPREGPHVALQAPQSCSPCLRKECGYDRSCAESITVTRVLEAVRSLNLR